MSDPPPPNERSPEGDAEPDEQPGSRALRDLVKRSLSGDALGADAPDLLLGVQRRIRKRSRGKFFGDGWGTTQARTSYVLVALVTLVLVALVFFALGPLDVR